VKQPVHLDIAGEGDQKLEMHALTEKLGLSDRVTFHGWVSPDKGIQLIRSARAVVFPSLWHEPGGTVAFEAMANSRAVIMSRVGGMLEVVLPEVNGLLVEPNNTRELTAAIECLASNYSLAVQLGEAGRKMASQQHTLAKHIEGLIHLYEQATRRKEQ